MSATTAVIVAAGRGERFGGGDKQFALLAGEPVLCHAIRAFGDAASVDDIVVVLRGERFPDFVREVACRVGTRKSVRLVEGGSTRTASVAAGLKECFDSTDFVLVHDGARPLVRSEWIDAAVELLRTGGPRDGLVFAAPSTDTIKLVQEGAIIETPSRDSFFRAETPQLFAFKTLLEAYRRAAVDGFIGTDDAAVVERVGGRVEIFETPGMNLKITTKADLDLAEAELRRRAGGG